MRRDQRLWWLLAALLLLRLLLAYAVPIAEDEAYYWEWSRRLALSYFDHPPMIAWSIAVGTSLLGDTVLGVRLFPVLMSVATVAAVYGLTLTLGGGRNGAWWAAVSASVLPLFAAGQWLASPDAPLLFFWALGLWATCLALRAGRWWQWALAGLALGLALISKYTAVVLPLALLAACLTMPVGRRALRRSGPYVGIACLLAPSLPVLAATLAAQAHGVAFQLAHGFGAGEALRPWTTLAEFVGGQLAVVTPLLFALFALALFEATRGWLRALPRVAGTVTSRSDAAALLPVALFPALATLALFTAASLFGDAEANWAAPAYVSACALLGPRVPGLLSRRWARLLVLAALSLALLASAVLLSDAVHPLIPARKSPGVAVRDRSELVAWVQGLRELEAGRVALLFSNHRLASFFAFSLPDRPATGAPLVRGSGSQYHRWRSPACDTREAWYFTDSPLKPYWPVLAEVRRRARFEERRLGRHVGVVLGYRGRTVAGLCRTH